MPKFRLEEIRIRRKKLDLTQLQLARQANVSQSIITKIEKSRIDPSYSSVLKIMDALDRIESKSVKKAEDLMVRRIVSVRPGDKVSAVVKLMEKHDISQIPVMHGGKAVGLITEKIIMDSLLRETSEEVKNSEARDLMEEAPPTVPCNASVNSVIPLLDSFPCILVIKKGKITGILAKSDIITKL